jgi:WD40 repeat protein/tRNA A-37 threonylcarbamoyl transferase component Bud32
VTPATSDQAAAIFLSLSDVDPADRPRVLDERCGDDAVLRQAVERLVAALDEADAADEDVRLGVATGPASLEDISPAPTPGTTIGGFRLVRQIGAGATGVVYVAQQQHPARVVALKVLRQELLASAVQKRFEIEAELLGRLHHPGIAEIYAADPGDGRTPPFIAMELVNGPPITEFVESGGLAVRDRVALVAAACDAVQHAHQRGIIHRDLKPGNILVDEEGQPKVVDFGVARPSDAAASGVTMGTEIGQLVGTLAYMSPEQVAAEPDGIDTRTDIHALGVVLFRLLTGRLPYAHDDPPLPELARRILQDNPPRLATFDASLRGDLEIIVSRALAKEKERRYASAAGFAADLRRYLAGQPISAAADSAWYVVRRRLGRYRAALAVSAAVVVALVALTIYANVQRSRADDTNRELQQQLATSTIERSRLLSLTGNVPIAESLAWRELFRQPDSSHARWTLWDIYSRTPSLWARGVHDQGTQTVRFSHDGKLVVTAGRVDGLIHLIDAASGRLVKTFAAQPITGVRRAILSPDGRSILAGSVDGTIRVWDVASGDIRRERPRLSPGLLDLAPLAATGTVVTAGSSGLRVWSMDRGEQVADLSSIAPAPVSLAASRDGRTVVVGDEAGSVVAVDVVARRRLWSAKGHDGRVFSVAIEPTRGLILSGGADATIQIWRADGTRARTIPTENGRVIAMAFDERGTILAAAGQWSTRVWALDEPSRPPREFPQAEGVHDVSVRADGGALVSANYSSGQVRVWDLAADARVAGWRVEGGRVTSLIVSPDARALVSTSANGLVSVREPGAAAAASTWQTDGYVLGAAVSGDGRFIVTVGAAGRAAIRDLRDGSLRTALTNVPSSRAVLVSDDERQLWIGDADGTVRSWDWADGRVSNERSWKSDPIEANALLARGRHLFVAHGSRVVILRDRATGRELRRYATTAAPFALGLTRDERLLVAGTYLGAVCVFDVQTGRMLGELSGPTAMATSLDFSPDDRLLAVTSRDGSTRLWDVTTRQWLATVARRTPGAERVRFLPDGRRLAIGYEDGVVVIHDLQYFFRHVGGHADYQLAKLGAGAAGERFPRAAEALAWARSLLILPPLPASPPPRLDPRAPSTSR